MVYHPIKFDCKKISSSVDTVIFDYMSPWTWRQQTNLFVRHSGPWRCITIPSLVTKGSEVEEILSRWTSIGILNLSCYSDHNRAIQSFHKTIQLTMVCHQTKFSCKRIRGSKDTLKSHTLIMWSFIATLTMKAANQSFGKTIWLMMIHHHTKCGSKRFCNSKGNTWTDIHWHFEMSLWPWPWTQ